MALFVLSQVGRGPFFETVKTTKTIKLIGLWRTFSHPRILENLFIYFVILVLK